MSKEGPDFWFPVKTFGWGWGLPVRWQGWVALGAYFGLQYLGIRYFRPQRDFESLLVYLAAITLALIAVVVWKGEKPSGWRWGDR
jgi:hypothetical protein